MGANSNIEWTEATWNPVVGCSIVSPGCTNCYAMRMASRIQKINRTGGSGTDYVNHYDGTTKPSKAGPVWTGKVALAPDKIFKAPLGWRKPRTVFVNSMGDLFHEDVPDEWIDRVFAVMALTPQHTYQVLTKRAERMCSYVSGFTCDGARRLNIAAASGKLMEDGDNAHDEVANASWPLPNVWLGVSTERQQEADERIPHLLQTLAAVRFISAEPLLGPIDLGRIEISRGYGSFLFDALTGRGRTHLGDPFNVTLAGIRLDWVIAGGESGPRPSHPDWFRSLRDQCADARAPFFFKQFGNWRPEIDRDRDDPDWRQPYGQYQEPHFQILNLAGGKGFHGERVHVMRRCSKRSAGRLLDGVEHNDMPGRAS